MKTDNDFHLDTVPLNNDPKEIKVWEEKFRKNRTNAKNKKKAVLLTLQENAEDNHEDLDINEIKKAHIQKHSLPLE